MEINDIAKAIGELRGEFKGVRNELGLMREDIKQNTNELKKLNGLKNKLIGFTAALVAGAEGLKQFLLK